MIISEATRTADLIRSVWYDLSMNQSVEIVKVIRVTTTDELGTVDEYWSLDGRLLTAAPMAAPSKPAKPAGSSGSISNFQKVQEQLLKERERRRRLESEQE